MWIGHGFGWSGMIFGGLMMLLFWGGLITLVVLAVRAFAPSGVRETPKGDDAGETALEIVNMRYARGEIGKTEYDEIVQDLTA